MLHLKFKDGIQYSCYLKFRSCKLNHNIQTTNRTSTQHQQTSTKLHQHQQNINTTPPTEHQQNSTTSTKHQQNSAKELKGQNLLKNHQAQQTKNNFLPSQQALHFP
jgi:hypothetical protein